MHHTFCIYVYESNPQFYSFVLEGDRRAYFEGAEWTIKEQKTKIGSMRKENKELHKHKHDRLMVYILLIPYRYFKFVSSITCKCIMNS